MPGPGTYAPTRILPKYKQKQSAVFVSNSKRDTHLSIDDSQDGVPGPGKYSIKSTFTPSPARPFVQNFGSGCERFKSTTPDPINLGPGYYEPTTTKVSPKQNDTKAPFCSTDLRFNNNVDMNPGPGSYQNVDIQRRV